MGPIQAYWCICISRRLQRFVLQSREVEFISFSDCPWGTLPPGINGIGLDVIWCAVLSHEVKSLKGPRGCGLRPHNRRQRHTKLSKITHVILVYGPQEKSPK
jgi:hypothetical protein